MRVYIAVDSEGSACVVREKHPDHVYGTWQADFIREQATAEAAAAVEGARDAGADDILVHDAGFIRGASPVGLVLHYDRLPRGIRVCLGGVRVKDAVDSSFDAAVLIGHHAMAGTEDGVMAHTFSSAAVKGMWLNERPIGEIGFEALQIGTFGVPVVMVSADEAGCREAKEWLGNIEVAPTKRGLGTHQAVSLHPQDACDLIRERTAAALARIGEFRPFSLPPPFEQRLECYTPEQARARCERAGGTMTTPSSFVVRTDSPLDFAT